MLGRVTSQAMTTSGEKTSLDTLELTVTSSRPVAEVFTKVSNLSMLCELALKYEEEEDDNPDHCHPHLLDHERSMIGTG